MPEPPKGHAVAPGDYAATPARRVQARAAHALVGGLRRWFFRVRIDVRGLQHLPPGEPLIVAAGPHRGWLDPFVVMTTLPAEPRVFFLGSAQATSRSPFHRAVIWLFGGMVPVSTLGDSNRESLGRSVAVLAAGNRLALFPEGWDQMDAPPDELQPIKRGAAFIAQHSGCRAVPAGVAGTQTLWRGMTVRIACGPPLDPPSPGASRRDAEAWTASLAAAIRDLMPPLPPQPPEAEKRWRWMTTLFR